MRRLKPNNSCQAPRIIKVVWRMPLFKGSRKGYSNDVPTEFRGRVGEISRLTSV